LNFDPLSCKHKRKSVSYPIFFFLTKCHIPSRKAIKYQNNLQRYVPSDNVYKHFAQSTPVHFC
jgi:hypothetical protein